MNSDGLGNLIKAVNERCIDLVLTNGIRCFKSETAIETELSEFRFMIFTAIKSSFINKERP